MVSIASELMTDIMTQAVPVAIVIELSNIIVCTFLRAAFGGRLWFGR